MGLPVIGILASGIHDYRNFGSKSSIYLYIISIVKLYQADVLLFGIRNCFVNFYCFPLLVCFFARFKLLNKVTYLSVLKIHEVNGRGDFLFLTAMELCTTMGIKENRYAIWLSELAIEFSLGTYIELGLAFKCQVPLILCLHE